MKLKEMPGFVETIPVLFEHFKKHGIETDLWYEADYDRILGSLMECEFASVSYNGNWEHYNIDFSGYPSTDDEVYNFTFGNDANPSAHFLLIDVDCQGRGFITMSFQSKKLLPVARALLGPDGLMALSVYDEKAGEKIVIHEKMEIMSDEELAQFLRENTRRGRLIGIEVE